MRNVPPEAFVKRFSQLLEEDGRSVDVIADELDVDRSQVYRWKNGERSPEGSNLAALADFFGVTMDWLWGRPGFERDTEEAPVDPPSDPDGGLGLLEDLAAEKRGRRPRRRPGAA